MLNMRGIRPDIMLHSEMAQLPVPALFAWGDSDAHGPSSSGQSLARQTVRRLEDKIDRLTAEKQRHLGDRGQLLDQDVHPDQDHSHALPSPSRSRS
jgi:hypothetical protein